MPAPTFPNNWEYGDDGCLTNRITQCDSSESNPSLTFPNNWKYGDGGCCSNVIVECIPIFGNVLAQENNDPILQEDGINEIALG